MFVVQYVDKCVARFWRQLPARFYFGEFGPKDFRQSFTVLSVFSWAGFLRRDHLDTFGTTITRNVLGTSSARFGFTEL